MFSFARSPRQLLRDRLMRAFEIVGGEPFDPLVQRSQHADYQANGALQLAERLGANPHEVARRVLAKADLDDLVDTAEVSGPGFINLTLANDLLGRMVGEASADDRLGVPVAEHAETVVVDYSAPNVAKEMRSEERRVGE